MSWMGRVVLRSSRLAASTRCSVTQRLAEVALKNFARNPGTKLYDNMVDGTDTYKVSLIQKPLTAKA